MWFCFNDGFVSAVESKDNPDNLVIRSRRLVDLENVVGTERDIVVGGGTDYKYRTEMTKYEWAKIVAKRVIEIDYTNFKSSTKDRPLHNLYVNMWRLHYKYQDHFS